MQQLLDIYYEENPKGEQDERTEEADKVSSELQNSYQKKHFHLHLMNTFLFIRNYLPVFTDMTEGL